MLAGTLSTQRSVSRLFPRIPRPKTAPDDTGADQGGESEGNMLTECCDFLGDEEEDCRNWDRLHFPSRKCDFLGIAFGKGSF